MPRSIARGAPLPDTDPRPVARSLGSYANQTFAIVAAEVQRIRHDPVELLPRAVQPVLWLTLFGGVMARIRGISPDNIPYLDFLAVGILAQSALSVAILYGMTAIWDHDFGTLQRYLVSPTPRSALVIGKALSAGVRGLAQALIVYGLALSLGVGIVLNPLKILGVGLVVVLGAALFSTFSLIIACTVKTRERFMGVAQVLIMPIFFASNAIYPLSLMPAWLSTVSRMNPLTYEVDALRMLMLPNGPSDYGLWFDVGTLTLITAVLTGIAARVYGRLGF